MSRFQTRFGLVLRLCLLAGAADSPINGDPLGYPLIEAFSSEVIKAPAHSWSVIQDHDGVLYFGCDSLVSFDGDRWRSVKVPSTYAWRGLDLGENGRIWGAAVGQIGWFEREAGNTWRFHSLTDKLPASYARPGEVWHAFAVNNNAIFVSSDAVMRWNGTSFQVWQMPGTRRIWATKIAGSVYVHHRSEGLFVAEETGPRKLIDASVLGFSDSIFWMEPQSDGWLFATAGGLFRFANGRTTPFAEDVARIGADRLITSATRLRDGRVIVGTFQGGLISVLADGRLERVIGFEDGLPTRSITALFVDREGMLWAVSPTHIIRISLQSRSESFDKRSGLPDQPCLRIVRHEDRLFVSTQDGVYSQKDPSSRFLPERELSQTPWIWDMRSTTVGLVTAGHHKVNSVVGGKVKDLHYTPNDVFSAIPSRTSARTIIAADGRSVVYIQTDGLTREVVRSMPDSATSVAEDSHGRLWLGTNGSGAFFAVPGKDAAVDATPIGEVFGVSATTGAWRVAASSGGSVVLLGEERGWLLDESRDKFIPINGYPRRALACISEFGPDGSVWLVYPEEKPSAPLVARIKVERGKADWHPHSVEGLPTIGTPTAIYAEPERGSGVTLWIGGTRGILRHHVENGPEAPAPPVPILRVLARTVSGGQLCRVEGPLPYSTQSVLLEFAAPQYAHRSSMRIESFVEGVDDKWQLAERGMDRELPAMRNGKYVVRVRSVAETGKTSGVVEFPFSVDPPWWRTIPAGIGAVVIIGATGAFGYRLRVRSLMRQNVRLEEKVRQRTEELQIANSAKSQFVASISHDVRNPLNGIIGIAYALDDPALGQKHRGLVARLRECATYLSRLVDDVLDFSQIEAGKIELRPGSYSPGDLLQSVAMIVQAEAKKRDAEVVVMPSPSLPKLVEGDSGRIQQVLVNFASNAIKYVGGRIVLRAEKHGSDERFLEYSVCDEGRPFTPQEEVQLFNMFSRLPGAQRDQIPGSGLGLVTCRRIATAMGGVVGVECATDQGKKFFLRTPFCVVATPAGTSAAAGFPVRRVLVVEDQDYNAIAAEAVLRQLRLECDRAENGAQAIKLFSTGSYQVVLMDRSLPDMDGTEVARQIRDIERGRSHTLILAVTASCTMEDRDACLAAGMDAFLGKPLTPEKLKNALVAASRENRSAASIQLAEPFSGGGLNTRVLEYLAEDSGVGVQLQIERYLNLLENIHAEVKKSMSTGNRKDIVAAAHQLSGHAKMVASVGLTEVAGRLEAAARDQAGADLSVFTENVEREVAILRKTLTDLRFPATPN